MANLRDFIQARRSEIKQQIQVLKSELADLDRAESAIAAGEQPVMRLRRTRSAMSIKDYVLDVLADHPDGADANEILALIGEKSGVEVKRTSLSPQLTRLKADGLIRLDGRIWRRETVSKNSEGIEDVLG